MFDKENFTPEFYDKLSDSEKKELVQVMLEDQLTDPLHIKGLPKPVQNCIKSAVKSSAKAMKEETIAGYPVEWINGIKSKDEIIVTGATKNFKPNQEFDRLQKIVDKPYPVMMPEDVKTMKGVSDEFMRKFREYVSEELGEPSHPTITIDSIPDNIREEAETEALIYGDCYILTGATKNFKVQQTCDKLEALYDILDTEGPDRNGRIWKREFMNKILNNRVFLTAPRGHKSWLWLKLLEMELQKSYEINLVQTLETPPSTKVDLKSVIYMKWPKQDLSNLKAHDFRYGKMWQEQALINYATGDVSHIDMAILDSLATFGPDIHSGYGLSTPNLNDIDKKKLERVIKRRKKK